MPLTAAQTHPICPACIFRRLSDTGSTVASPEDEVAGLRSPVPREGKPDTDFYAEYELLGEIGRGGMGIIYKAHQPGLNRIVALKVIHAAGLQSEAAHKRFQAEVKVAARLNHPNIVPIFDVGAMDGCPCYSMEFFEGGNLADRLNKPGLRIEDGVALLVKVAHAVFFAHQHGVLHRDLKPANILLDAKGEPHVGDFGLAKQLDSDSDLTRSGTVLGSPNYMSPEQAAGQSRSLTVATDVYSLGAILYQLLTGRPPFLAATPLETLRLVVEQEPQRPSTIAHVADRDLETICLKCLEKEPARRYETAEELARDLERWLRHEPILARPASGVERVRKWVKRRPAVAALSALLILALVSALATVLSMNVRLAHQAKETRRQLVRLHGSTGDHMVDEGDTFGGLIHYTEALRLEQGDLPREESHRYRIEAALRHAPELLHVWAIDADALAFTPDGQRLLIGGEDRLAHIMDVRTGLTVSTNAAHASRVRVANVSPEGRRFVTFTEKGLARVWNAATGKALTPELRHEDFSADPVDFSAAKVRPTAVFSPDGRHILTAHRSKMACLWDATTGRLVQAFRHPAVVNHAAFSRDGAFVITSGTDKMARTWDARTGDPAGPPLPHDRFVAWAQFSPNGTDVMTISDRMKAQVWNWRESRTLGSPMTHGVVLFDAMFSPDGRQILTASWDNTARLWDAATGLRVAIFNHDAGLYAAAFSPDGKWVVTACADGKAHVWDTENHFRAHALLPQRDEVRRVVFSPDGTLLATASLRGEVRLWNLASCDSVVAAFPQPEVTLAEFSPDERWILAAGKDGQGYCATLWETASGRQVGSRLQLRGQVRAAAFLTDGQGVLLATLDGKATRWNPWAGQETPLEVEHNDRVRAAAFSPDRRRLATGGLEGGVRLWDLLTNGTSAPPMQHKEEVTVVAFSPDGAWLATGSKDRTARIWDAATGQPLCPELVHPGVVRDVVFSPRGDLLATAGGREIRIWDIRHGKPVGLPLRTEKDVQVVRFSPNGRRVITGGDDRGGRVWDIATGAAWTPPMPHSGTIVDMQFSPDGRRVATLTKLDELRLWDAHTGEALTSTILHKGSRNGATVRFSADGQRVLIATHGPAAWIRELPKSSESLTNLLDQAQILSGRRFDATGALVPLGKTNLTDRWNALRTSR